MSESPGLDSPSRGRPSLAAMAVTFLKIGTFGFGGPYALLAFLEKEVVSGRGWLTAEDFAESAAVGAVTPGPIFFSAAVHVGYRLRGLAGATLAAVTSLAPAFALAVVFAALYLRVEGLPQVGATARAMTAAVTGLLVAVVFTSVKGLIREGRAAREGNRAAGEGQRPAGGRAAAAGGRPHGQPAWAYLAPAVTAVGAFVALEVGRVNAAWVIVGAALLGLALGPRASAGNGSEPAAGGGSPNGGGEPRAGGGPAAHGAQATGGAPAAGRAERGRPKTGEGR